LRGHSQNTSKYPCLKKWEQREGFCMGSEERSKKELSLFNPEGQEGSESKGKSFSGKRKTFAGAEESKTHSSHKVKQRRDLSTRAGKKRLMKRKEST